MFASPTSQEVTILTTSLYFATTMAKTDFCDPKESFKVLNFRFQAIVYNFFTTYNFTCIKILHIKVT